MIVQSPAITWERRALGRWMSFAGKLSLVTGVILVIARLGTGDPGAFASLSMLGGPLVVLMSYLVMMVEVAGRGSIEVRDDAAIVTRRGVATTLKLRSIAGAWVVMRRAPVVEICTRFGNVVQVEVPDTAAAHALVEALGFGPSGRAISIDLARRGRRVLHAPIVMISAVMAFVLTTLFFAFFSLLARWVDGSVQTMLLTLVGVGVAVYAFLKRFFAAPVVTLGNDGVVVRRRFRKQRVTREEIARVGRAGEKGPFVIERRHGLAIAVDGVMLDDARLVAVASEAERRLWGGMNVPSRAASFERAGRDVAEWKTALRATLDAGYREAGASIEDANAVLANPSASVDQRLGAALALRIAGEPPARIRVAADGTVDPQVRVALEAIADDEDEHLEKALGKLARARR